MTHDNILFKTFVINSNSVVLELGCGVSGIIALTMSSKVQRYICTDQDYVFKKLKTNLAENPATPKESGSRKKNMSKNDIDHLTPSHANIEVIALDWESSLTSSLQDLLRSTSSKLSEYVNVVLACDCIFNEALLDPFIQTCEELCRTSPTSPTHEPAICVIAQQLRSHFVFEAWLVAFHKKFKVWRVPDELLSENLASGSGFAIHVGILRDAIT